MSTEFINSFSICESSKICRSIVPRSQCSVLDEASGLNDGVELTVEGLATTKILVSESVLDLLGKDGNLVETTLGELHEDKVEHRAAKQSNIHDPVLLEDRLNSGRPGVLERLPVGVTAVDTRVVVHIVTEVVDDVVEVGSERSIVGCRGHAEHGQDGEDEESESHF